MSFAIFQMFSNCFRIVLRILYFSNVFRDFHKCTKLYLAIICKNLQRHWKCLKTLSFPIFQMFSNIFEIFLRVFQSSNVFKGFSKFVSSQSPDFCKILQKHLKYLKTFSFLVFSKKFPIFLRVFQFSNVFKGFWKLLSSQSPDFCKILQKH